MTRLAGGAALPPDGGRGGAYPPLVRTDALPEHTAYADTGCDLAPSCLRCPFARCRYDVPHSVRWLSRRRRDREIALLRRRYRAPIDLLAQAYGMTRRQIFRVLRQELEAGGRLASASGREALSTKARKDDAHGIE